MGRKMLVIMNHTLVEDQILDAKNNLNVGDIVYMPEELQHLWGHIDPAAEDISYSLRPIKDWIIGNAHVGAVVLIQGDMGATYNIVSFCMGQWVDPMYATTDRVSTEEKLPDGSVKKVNVFKHIRFRKYM